MIRRYGLVWLVAVCIGILGVNGLAGASQAESNVANDTNYQVFAFNDLGMHCYDKDFSVFSLLPLFNTIHAQVVYKDAKPVLLNDAQIKLFYAATPDSRGSINTTSIGKTNFWTYIAKLFGPAFNNWPQDIGILGARMPNSTFGPQFLSTYEAGYHWFTAGGIPFTNIDDTGIINSFPLMRIQAGDISGRILRSSLDIVVPNSSEMNCAACHETADFVPLNPGSASDASPPPRLTTLAPTDFSDNPDPNIRFRENILILHDGFNPGLNLFARYKSGQPTLCAQCHYSKALDLAGNNQPTGDQVGHVYLSRGMHKHHGTAWPMMDGTYVVPIPGEGVTQCYYCHPGNDTQCLRSVMAVQGMQCQSCHGELLQVGGFTPQLGTPGFVDPYLPNVNDPSLIVNLTSTGAQRRPWVDMPKCQACHAGDALNHLGDSLIGAQAYDAADPAATPFVPVNQRFAENPGQLFRFSNTHGGVACASCHGSPHAEWPARIDSSDNITATQIQGHTGEISECGACHADNLAPGLGGPHGLHNVNDPGWMAQHGVFWRQNRNACKACHNIDLHGTVLSRAKADRTLSRSRRIGGVINLPKGTPVDCYACHTTIPMDITPAVGLLLGN
ncbi:MAG: cytochrome C [Desulfobaccales bacterium]